MLNFKTRIDIMFAQLKIINNAQSSYELLRRPKQQTESQKCNEMRNPSIGASSVHQILSMPKQIHEHCLNLFTYLQQKNNRMWENNNKNNTNKSVTLSTAPNLPLAKPLHKQQPINQKNERDPWNPNTTKTRRRIWRGILGAREYN